MSLWDHILSFFGIRRWVRAESVYTPVYQQYFQTLPIPEVFAKHIRGLTRWLMKFDISDVRWVYKWDGSGDPDLLISEKILQEYQEYVQQEVEGEWKLYNEVESDEKRKGRLELVFKSLGEYAEREGDSDIFPSNI